MPANKSPKASATSGKAAATTAKASAGKPAASAKPASPKPPAGKPATAARKPDGAADEDLATRFHHAAAAAKQTKKRPDNATLLKLYSYYKQATDGDIQGERPGGFDFVGGAKYDAWAKLKGMDRDEAMTQYIRQVERLNRE